MDNGDYNKVVWRFIYEIVRKNKQTIGNLCHKLN